MYRPDHAGCRVNRKGEGTLELVGELDYYSCQKLRAQLFAELATADHLTLDLEALTFIDCSCAGAIKAAATHLGKGKVRLVHPTNAVMKVIAMTGLDRLANVEVIANMHEVIRKVARPSGNGNGRVVTLVRGVSSAASAALLPGLQAIDVLKPMIARRKRGY